MNARNQLPGIAGDLRPQTPWPLWIKKLAIWSLFVLVLYLARDFFFTAFMTFVFCYATLAVVDRIMQRLAPGQPRPGLRRLVTLGVFIITPLLLLAVGWLLGPRLVAEAEQMAGWAKHVNPEGEVTRLLEGWVGDSEFKDAYGGPSDPRYQKALEEFRQTGVSHVAAYYTFPSLEAWLEAGFSMRYLDGVRAQLRNRVAREGPSSAAFADWLQQVKYPALRAQAEAAGKALRADQEPPLVQAAAQATADQLLQQVRHDPAALAGLLKEWSDDAVEQGMRTAKGSPEYLEQFKAYYEQRRNDSPTTVPYTFDQYMALKKARTQGPAAFGKVFGASQQTDEDASQARIRADFEAATKHALFQQWWEASSLARVIRHEMQFRLSDDEGNHAEKWIETLLNLPVDLSTALLLSLFICIDFPQLRSAMRKLRETWLRSVYDEVAPALHDLSELIGRSMHAQGLIALCNATLMFFALLLIGVEHAALLAGATFVLCLVPTLGTVIAWVLIAGVALIQPGGGLMLALKASGAVLLIICIETFVLSPRILGKMMELHPVLVIAILPVAQYFFGIWGLILATPVAVYVIHVLILRRGLPGSTIESKEVTAASPPAAVETPAVGAGE